MDLLNDDLLINIVARVVAHSMYDLFNFQRTNKRYDLFTYVACHSEHWHNTAIVVKCWSCSLK